MFLFLKNVQVVALVALRGGGDPNLGVAGNDVLILLESELEVQGGRNRAVLQEDPGAGLYIVKYTAEEVNHIAIHVFWNNSEIPESASYVRICDSTVVKPMEG